MIKKILVALFLGLFALPCFAATKLEDEGVNQGYINVLDFTGAGVTATRTGIQGNIVIGGADISATSNDTEVLYNSSNVITGDDKFLYDDSAKSLWLYDSTGADYLYFRHDGTGAMIGALNGDIEFITVDDIRLGVGDNVKTKWGGAEDAEAYFDGDSLNITANAVTATDDLEITAERLTIGNADNAAGILQINEDTDDGTNNVTFTVPALAADVDYILPNERGGAGEQLTDVAGNGVLSWEAAGGAGATAYDDIGDPDAAGSISFDDDETATYTSAEDTGSFFNLLCSDADLAGATTILKLSHADNDDALGIFLQCYDDSGGDNDLVFQIGQQGQLLIGEGANDYSLPNSSAGAINGDVLTYNGAGAITFVAGAGSTRWDDIGDPDNNGLTTIDFDNAAENTILTTVYDAAGSFFTIQDSDADIANAMYLLNLDYSVDDDQANADYLICQDAGGAVFTINQNGDTVIAGTLGVTGAITGNVTGNVSGSSGSCTGNAATATTASAGDAALDFFGAGVTAVTDATACTDIEGTGLTIAGGVLNVDDAYLKLGGDVATAGVYDFGSVNVVLEIPNAAAPTTDATGEMAIDTDLITQGMLQVYLASAIANVVATTDTPGDNEVPTYDAVGGTIQWEAPSGGGGESLAATLAIGADANDVDITSIAKLEGVDVNTYIDMDTTDIITTKGNLIPSANGADDLGTDALEYNNAWFDGTMEADTITEGGVGVPNTNDNLSVFAATTSAQLYGVLSDETGSAAGAPLAVFNQAPTIDSPTFTTAITATDLIDSAHYAADSIDNEHINWTDIDNLGDEGVIPSGAAVTDPNAAGELAIDTTSDQFLYYGSAQRVIPYFYERGFVLEDPAAADDDVPFWHPHANITITDCYCETQGGTSCEVIISDGTNALETITCDADGQADDGSIANGSFSANERMEFDIGTVTGAVDWVAFTITYVIDPD